MYRELCFVNIQCVFDNVLRFALKRGFLLVNVLVQGLHFPAIQWIHLSWSCFFCWSSACGTCFVCINNKINFEFSSLLINEFERFDWWDWMILADVAIEIVLNYKSLIFLDVRWNNELHHCLARLPEAQHLLGGGYLYFFCEQQQSRVDQSVCFQSAWLSLFWPVALLYRIMNQLPKAAQEAGSVCDNYIKETISLISWNLYSKIYLMTDMWCQTFFHVVSASTFCNYWIVPFSRVMKKKHSQFTISTPDPNFRYNFLMALQTKNWGSLLGCLVLRWEDYFRRSARWRQRWCVKKTGRFWSNERSYQGNNWVVATHFILKCSSLFGEMIQFDEHIFLMGWFDHQLDKYLVNSDWWIFGCNFLVEVLKSPKEHLLYSFVLRDWDDKLDDVDWIID